MYAFVSIKVMSQIHPHPKVDETLAQLAGATCFTKLDVNSGFWQISFICVSGHLTIWSPFGRYCFNKLISCAPELFQKSTNALLHNLVCLFDEILVFGPIRQQHDE